MVQNIPNEFIMTLQKKTKTKKNPPKISLENAAE